MERCIGYSSKHETVDFEIQTETYVIPPTPPQGEHINIQRRKENVLWLSTLTTMTV